MVSRRSVKRRSRQDDTLKARKLRLIANLNGTTVPAKIVRVKKGRKSHMFPMNDCSMELDEAGSAHYAPIVGSSERIPERPRNVSLSTMSNAHRFGIHGSEIVSAIGDIHINKYSPPNSEMSVNRIPTTSSLPTVPESGNWMFRNTAQEPSESITDLQFPDVLQTLSSCFQGIRRYLIPSRTTVDDIIHSPVFLVDFPTGMIPEDTQTYSRLMLQFKQGYPLYRPTPIRGVSEAHWKKGVRIGDVGRVTPDGSFEFLFNINPNEPDSTQLPDGFENLHQVDSFQEPDYYPRGEHLLKGRVEQTRNSPITYKFSTSGAILQLPEGAIHFEAQNKNDFSTLASQYAQRWYKYMNVDRSMGAPNGSLYLITGCIKCTSCATAVFSESHIGENWLEFHYEGLRARPRYTWKRMGPITARVNQNQEDLGDIDVAEPRHCAFIRGFKITLGDKQWNELIEIAVTQHSSQERSVEASGSGGASWSADHVAKDGCDTSRQYASNDSVFDNNRDTECSPIIQQLSSSASPMHPSDIINAILLQRHPEAKVAITHDDDWLGLFPKDHSVDPFSLPVDALLKILDETYSTIDEHGCVSLAKATHQEPAQGSMNMETTSTSSNVEGRKASSALDVGQSDDGRDSTYKPPPYIVKETDDLPGLSCASLVPCSFPPPTPVGWQVFAEDSPPITRETSTTFDNPIPVPEETAIIYTKESSPPDDPQYIGMSNRLTPATVSSHLTSVKPSTQDTSFDLDSSPLFSLPSSQLSPLSLQPLRKAEEKRKYEKRSRDEGRETESDNLKKKTSQTAQGLRSKDEKRIQQHTTAEGKQGRQTMMLPSMVFPPPSSAAQGLIKTEDKQEDVSDDFPASQADPSGRQHSTAVSSIQQSTKNPISEDNYYLTDTKKLTETNVYNESIAQGINESGLAATNYYTPVYRAGNSHTFPRIYDSDQKLLRNNVQPLCHPDGPAVDSKAQSSIVAVEVPTSTYYATHPNASTAREISESGLDAANHSMPGYRVGNSHTLTSTHNPELQTPLNNAQSSYYPGILAIDSIAKTHTIALEALTPVNDYSVENANTYSKVFEGNTMGWDCNYEGCQYTSRSKRDMERHCSNLSHHDGGCRRHLCEHCGRAFTRWDTLRRHVIDKHKVAEGSYRSSDG